MKSKLLGTITIILVALIGILGWMLWKKQSDPDITTHGTEYIQPAPTNMPAMFSDGLALPDVSTDGKLDETGAGIEKTDVFYRDLNQDKLTDKITRVKHENGTSHFWYEYKIELQRNNNTWNNVTPNGFRTTEGAECALQKLQFIFKPSFKVIKISRPWKDSWDTPTMATKTVWELKNNVIHQTKSEQVGQVCDVTELFFKK